MKLAESIKESVERGKVPKTFVTFFFKKKKKNKQNSVSVHVICILACDLLSIVKFEIRQHSFNPACISV